jgi:SecD/SecF fusion protein
MARYFKKDIDFLGKKKAFFAISGFLCAASIVAVIVCGLNLGIEFVGGTSITFSDSGSVTLDEMRTACEDAGLTDPTIQTTSTNGTAGFLVRTNVTDPNESASDASAISDTLGLSSDSYEISVIGPDWGTTVLHSSLIAFIVAMAAIIVYVAIRFEWKMGLIAVLALFHDLLIVVGIYALFQIEVTPNVIAALLTIMGYSLYDTVVVFHRMNENGTPDMKCSFMSMANHSINQVFTRTINTSLVSLVPVLAMLFFGGETLKGFAFAMTIGLVLGSYSSIGVASPLYALWKSREPGYAKLAKRYGYERWVTDPVISGLYSMADLAAGSVKGVSSEMTTAASAMRGASASASASVSDEDEAEAARETEAELPADTSASAQVHHTDNRSRAQRKKSHH